MIPYFVKLNETRETLQLMRDGPAFALLSLIAYRANKSHQANVDGLKFGQAFVGDHRTIGLSEKAYRGAKERLAKGGLAAFQGTNKGTIATLLNRMVYDIERNEKGEHEGEPTANQGRTEGEPRATKSERREKKEERRRAGDPLVSFLELIQEEEFRVLDVDEIRDVATEWVKYRAEIKKTATPRSVRIDAKHMVQILAAGGEVALIVSWIERAMESQWRGWFFPEHFSRWKAERAADPELRLEKQFLGARPPNAEARLFKIMTGGLRKPGAPSAAAVGGA